MKVELDDVVLSLSAIDNKAQVGIQTKGNESLWKHKKEIDNNFIACVIHRWKGQEETFTDSSGKTFIVSVREEDKK